MLLTLCILRSRFIANSIDHNLETRFSKNNKTFGIPILINPEIKSKKTTGTLQIKTPQKTQFIKLKIQGIGTCPPGHPGDGNPAWFFIDEIIIE